MPKINIMGKVYHYEADKDELYYDKMSLRLMNDKTFKRVPMRDVTNKFISSMLKIVDPNHRHEENSIWSMSGETGCQPKNSRVLMADGEFKNIQDIKIGDKIISFDKNLKSKIEIVLRTTKWKCCSNYDIIQLNRHKKKLYSCSFNHLIPMSSRTIRRKNRIKGNNKCEWNMRNIYPKELFKLSMRIKQHNLIGLSSPPIQNFKNKTNCEIEPYTLGYYISDGSFCRGYNSHGKRYFYLNITSMDDISIDYINNFYPYNNYSKKKDNKAKTYSWKVGSEFGIQLKKAGMSGKPSGQKFIPKEALHSDLEYRRKLLAGLIDGDGYISKNSGNYDFVSKSPQLINDIEFLIYSIGGRVNNKKRIIGKIREIGFKDYYWYISFHIYENLNIPLLIERREKKKVSYYLDSNRLAIDVKKNNKIYDVYGFTLSGETGYYITDNFMLTHNSGKTISIMSLLKLIVPDRFSYKNFCFYDEEILELAKKVPRDSFIVRDEGTAKGVFGIGSNRQSAQLSLISEVSRKRGLSLCFIEPTEKINDVVKWYMETIDMDTKNRITRIALKEPKFMQYLGAIYVPIIPNDDKDWVLYNHRKDSFILDATEGRMTGAKSDPIQMAKEVLEEIDTELYTNKKERKAFIISKYPTYTSGEIDLISTHLEIEIRKNGY